MNLKNVQNATTVLTLVGAVFSVAYGVLIVTKEIKTLIELNKIKKETHEALEKVTEKFESM